MSLLRQFHHYVFCRMDCFLKYKVGKMGTKKNGNGEGSEEEHGSCGEYTDIETNKILERSSCILRTSKKN